MNNLRKKHETLSLGSDWGRRILQLNSVDSMPAIVFPQLNCGGSPSVPDFQCFNVWHVSKQRLPACLCSFGAPKVVTKSVMRDLCGHLPWQGHGRKYPCFYSLLIISFHALGIWACHFWSILWNPDSQLTLKVTVFCHWQPEQTLCTLSPGPINL